MAKQSAAPLRVETTSANFRRAIAIASKVVERTSTIPVLSGLRCHANGSLEVAGTDLDIALTATVAREPGPDLDFVLQAPVAVSTAIGAAGDKTVSLTHADGKVSLTSGSLDLSVSTFPADDFPVEHRPNVTEHFSATLSRDAVAAIGRVADAMSSEETRYYLNGVRLKSVGATTIQAQATDGHRLYLADIQVPDAKGDLGENCIIPRKAVRLLIDLAKSAQEGVSLMVGSAAPSNQIESTAPARAGAPRLHLAMRERAADVAMTSKLIDGTFPAVEKVIPAGGDKQVLFEVGSLRRALAAVSGHSRNTRAVKITLGENDTATISAAYIDFGLSAAVKVPCKHNAAGFEIGFNGGYLSSIISAANGDEVLFTLTDPAAPALVRNPADTAWTGVLMPMKF